MVLVSVGSTRNDFSRLLRKVDELAGKGVLKDVFAQIGLSSYVPRHCSYDRFIKKDLLLRKIHDSDFVICHAGTGTVHTCLGLRKKVILVPRRVEFQEHPDNHQIELSEYLASKNRVMVVHDIEDLRQQVEQIPFWHPDFKREQDDSPIGIVVDNFIRHSFGINSTWKASNFLE